MTEVILELLDDPAATAVSAGQEDIVEIQVQSEATVVLVPVTEFIEISEQGPTGPPGSGGSGASTYVHTQSTAAATWIVTHNLGFPSEPTVLLDSAPTIPVLTDLEHAPGGNQTTIIFPTPVTGKAYF